MSLQQEVFAIPQLWSRHLALFSAWSDSAFAATQECLKLHFATWGQGSDSKTLEFPFVNLCQPHAVFTLQEQWTIPNLEHLVDYQSACTQILSETGQRMAQAWADYEVLNPASLGEINTVQWQIPGWDFSFSQLTSTTELKEPAVSVSTDVAEPASAEVLSDDTLIREAAPSLTSGPDTQQLADEASPAQSEFAEMEQQQAADAAAAVVAKARASFPQAPRISASKTAAKSVRASRSKTSTAQATASPAKATASAKKKSSKA